MGDLSDRQKAGLRAAWGERAKVIVCGFTPRDMELLRSVTRIVNSHEETLAREILVFRLGVLRWVVAGSEPGEPNHFLFEGLREEMDGAVLELLQLDTLRRDPAGWMQQREDFYGTPVRHDGPVNHTMQVAGRLFANCLGHADLAAVREAGETIFAETYTLLTLGIVSATRPQPGLMARLMRKLTGRR